MTAWLRPNIGPMLVGGLFTVTLWLTDEPLVVEAALFLCLLTAYTIGYIDHMRRRRR